MRVPAHLMLGLWILAGCSKPSLCMTMLEYRTEGQLQYTVVSQDMQQTTCTQPWT